MHPLLCPNVWSLLRVARPSKRAVREIPAAVGQPGFSAPLIRAPRLCSSVQYMAKSPNGTRAASLSDLLGRRRNPIPPPARPVAPAPKPIADAVAAPGGGVGVGGGEFSPV
jgi:hypothetical protein